MENNNLKLLIVEGLFKNSDDDLLPFDDEGTWGRAILNINRIESIWPSLVDDTKINVVMSSGDKWTIKRTKAVTKILDSHLLEV